MRFGRPLIGRWLDARTLIAGTLLALTLFDGRRGDCRPNFRHTATAAIRVFGRAQVGSPSAQQAICPAERTVFLEWCHEKDECQSGDQSGCESRQRQ